MEQPTLGVEEEFLLADGTTGDLRQDSEEVLRRAVAALGKDGLDHELHTGMVETGSAVCPDLRTLRAELLLRRQVTAVAAAEIGVRVLASASHPVALPEQAGYADDARYRQMGRDFGPLAAETLVCGCHVHVAVPDRTTGVGVIDRIRPWLSVLLALSANSPIWRGVDTGYDSWRTQVWSRWPTAGPTSLFGSLAAYEERADALVGSGALLDRGMLYYEARLSEHLPTVELRVADVCLEVDDALLVAALARALVMTASADLARPAPETTLELLRAATFVAARHGLRGRLLDPVTQRARPAAEVLDHLVAHVAGALEVTGDAALVRAGLTRVLHDGNGATRQRAALARGGHTAVLDLVALDPAPRR